MGDTEEDNIQFHKHCQKTVLSAFGPDGTGATWDKIYALNLPNLVGNWRAEFERNTENITQDLASILKIVNDNCKPCDCDCNLLAASKVSDGNIISRNRHVYKIDAEDDLNPTVDLKEYQDNTRDIVRFEYHIRNARLDKTIRVNKPTLRIHEMDNPTDWTVSCFTDDNLVEKSTTAVFVFRADMELKLLEYGLAYKRTDTK